MPEPGALGLTFRELGDGPPLLLLNGYAATKDDWDPGFLEALGGASRVICPDHRGIGGSPALPGETTIAAMAADALALADALDLEAFDLAGWSMGGMVAQEIAATAPERVGRLVLLSTDHGGPDAVLADPAVWTRLIDHGGSPREQATRLLSLIFPPELGAVIDEQFGEIVAAARAALPEETLFAQERAIDAWHAAPHGERTARITAPTLVAAGTEDVVIPPANAGLLAGALADAHAQTFPGGGHAFMAQVPVDLAATINGFLGR